MRIRFSFSLYLTISAFDHKKIDLVDMRGACGSYNSRNVNGS